MMMPRYVFVGGLHKSGTSWVHRLLRAHPDVSGFEGTGVHQDEGQLLQTVYRSAAEHGGWGRFGFDEEAHLTEESDIATTESAQLLLEQWGARWDQSQPVLVEKSPPNLVRTRFLQQLFPDSAFVVILRHPISVSLASLKWAKHPVQRRLKRRTLDRLVDHWVTCHRILEADAAHIKRLHVLKYEDLVKDTGGELARIQDFLGLYRYPVSEAVRQRLTEDPYVAQWQRNSRRPFIGMYSRRVTSKHEKAVRHFGYSLRQPSRIEPWHPQV